MCDTFVAVPEVARKQSMLFAKNSDREPNEAQAIVRIPAMDHKEREVHLTHRSIPQVHHTYEIIISRPFQMWGAEMGVNEYGLLIGNEAIFSRVPIKKPNKELTGMDLLRLALERTKDAENAVSLITSLIQDYGQNGWGGYTDQSLYYHNGFIIADRKNAYVLEAVGKEWALEKVHRFRSISNAISIGEEFDDMSSGLIEHARKNGWLKKGENFNFAKVYSDTFFTYMAKGRIRQKATMKTGTSCGVLNAENAFDILRSHADFDDFNFSDYNMGSVCMHAQGLFTPSQTTGSMVAEIPEKGDPIVWLTGTAAPCLSLFKPFFFGSDVLNQENFPQPGGAADTSLWWEHERFHRLALQSKDNLDWLKEEQTEFENRYRALVSKASVSSIREKNTLSREALTRAKMLQEKWLARISDSPCRKGSFLYRWNWKRWNKKAGIKIA